MGRGPGRSGRRLRARRWLGSERIELDQIDSTSEELWRRAKAGAAHGTVLTARHQSAGRGRQGRSWIAARGNLMVSWLLRLERAPAQAGALSIVQGLALARALDVLAPGRVRLKWPNDLQLDGLKVAGLLVEARNIESFCAVSGLGLNVIRPPEGWAELDGRAISLQEAGVELPIDELLEGLLAELESGIGSCLRDGPGPAFAQWSRWSSLDGRSIEWEDDGRMSSGTVEGLATDGGLMVSDAKGKQRVLYAGEVHLREGA